MSDEFQVSGQNPAALFSLKLHRGEGMTLIAMNWKEGEPPDDLVGFAIEYKEPGGAEFFPLKNRLSFRGAGGEVDAEIKSTKLSPIQMFRWVHFPRNAELPGEFIYKVSPVFMNANDELNFGESQEVAIELRRETFPGQLNVCFTRGFVSSQAFVDHYVSKGPISTLLPDLAKDGLTFVPTHPSTKEALAWMGFEARAAILELLDEAIADEEAQVRAVAYDLSEPDVVSRFEKLGNRLKVIIDNDGAHGEPDSGETQAETRLIASAGAGNVKRHHMGKLQHNKTIVVSSPNIKKVVCGSTNYTWRGFFVQCNNAIVLKGQKPVKLFLEAFDNYFAHSDAAGFGATDSAKLTDLGLDGIDVSVAFSPHAADTALLAKIAKDIGDNTQSCLFYSLAFLFQTPGPILDAIKKVSAHDDIFVYGISDKEVGGIDLQKPDGNIAPVSPTALAGNTPEPFKSEPVGGRGTRMHHKFVVIDFDKPSARVYMGSYNFSGGADTTNGENLLVIRDRRIAVAYVIEALRMFDHYHFRLIQEAAAQAQKELVLAKPPRKAGETPWWKDNFTNARKIRDRKLFA